MTSHRLKTLQKRTGKATGDKEVHVFRLTVEQQEKIVKSIGKLEPEDNIVFITEHSNDGETDIEKWKKYTTDNTPKILMKVIEHQRKEYSFDNEE